MFYLSGGPFFQVFFAKTDFEKMALNIRVFFTAG
jgi:hypothetical protein